MLVKIYIEDDNLIFETLVNEDIPNQIYLKNSNTTGVIVIDTANNLGITKQALKELKIILELSEPISPDEPYNFRWYKNRDNKSILYWKGENKLVINIYDDYFIKAKGTRIKKGMYRLIE